MSMIKCKECGKEISSSAEHCPYCGCSGFMQNVDNKTAIKIIASVLIIFFISLFILRVLF